MSSLNDDEAESLILTDEFEIDAETLKSNDEYDFKNLEDCEDIDEIPIHVIGINEGINDNVQQYLRKKRKEQQQQIENDENTRVLCYDKNTKTFSLEIKPSDFDKEFKEVQEIAIYPKIDSIFADYAKRMKKQKFEREQENKRKEYERKKLRKKYYYQPGIIAKIDKTINDNNLRKLLKNGVRTFLIQIGYETQNVLDNIMIRIKTAIKNFHLENNKYRIPITLAAEIHSDYVYLGRFRNDDSFLLEFGTLTILTCNENYQYKSVKEIIYVTNLCKYMNLLKINDNISVYDDRNRIEMRIVKILNKNFTVLIQKGGEIKSYMNVELPYYIIPNENDPLTDNETSDIEFCVTNDIDFIVVPLIRKSNYLKKIVKYLKIMELNKQFNIIAKLYVSNRFNEMNIFNYYETKNKSYAIWIHDLFVKNLETQQFNTNTTIVDKLIDMLMADSIDDSYNMVPLIGTIPIKTLKDFNILEGNKYLKYLQSIVIEKSLICNEFPLIAKRLLTINVDFNTCNANSIFESNNTGKYIGPHDGLVNCLNYTVRSMPCQGIIASDSFKDKLPHSLTSLHIYCPVICVIDNGEEFAKSLNIWRNLKPIIYPKRLKREESALIDYGIKYGKDTKLFKTSDFVLTFFDHNYLGTIASKLKVTRIQENNILIKKRKIT